MSKKLYENLEKFGFSIEKALADYANIELKDAQELTSSMSIGDYVSLANALDQDNDEEITDIVDKYINNQEEEFEESFSGKEYILENKIDKLSENINKFVQRANYDNFMKSDILSSFSLMERFVYKNYLPDNIRNIYEEANNLGIIQLRDSLYNWQLDENLSHSKLVDLYTFNRLYEDEMSPEQKRKLAQLTGSNTSQVTTATYNDPQTHKDKRVVSADPTSRTVATVDDDGEIDVEKVNNPKQQITFEDRKEDSEVEYKEKKVRGEIDRVIAELKGNKSGMFTKMAKQYSQIDRLVKKLGERREQLNEQAKEHITDMFNVEDEIYTRVIETVSITLTLAKKSEDTPERTETRTEFDTEGFISELFDMLPNMEKELLELKEKYTKINEIKIPGRKASSPALRVKVKENKVTDLWDKLKEYASNYKDKFMNRLKSYDDKLNSLKRKIKDAELDESLQLRGFEETKSNNQYDSDIAEMRRLAGLF